MPEKRVVNLSAKISGCSKVSAGGQAIKYRLLGKVCQLLPLKHRKEALWQ